MSTRFKIASILAALAIGSAWALIGSRTAAGEPASAELPAALPAVTCFFPGGGLMNLVQPIVQDVGGQKFLVGQEFSYQGELIPTGINKMVSLGHVQSIDVYKSLEHYKLILAKNRSAGPTIDTNFQRVPQRFEGPAPGRFEGFDRRADQK